MYYKVNKSNTLLWLCVCLAIFCGSLYFTVPQLVSDYRIKSWRPAPELVVKSADCRFWWFLVSSFEIKYLHILEADRIPDSLHYLVYGSWGREKVELVRAVDDPSTISVTFATRDIGARVITALLFLSFIALILFSIVKVLLSPSVDEADTKLGQRQ